MMSAVAKLKQTVKSASEAHELKQRFNEQLQLKKTSAFPTRTSPPSLTVNSWDFHPLMGSLMDAVITVADDADGDDGDDDDDSHC